MPIICAGRGHSHATVDEVRACQGVPPRGVQIQRAHTVRCDAHGREPHTWSDQCVNAHYVRERESVQVTEGMWKLGDRIFKVQIAHHGSGRPYGKELVVKQHTVYQEGGREPGYSHYWEKVTGAVRMLSEQGGRKMTLEEATKFGALYGFCCNCGRILTDEKSIEAGIGPVCAARFA